MTLSVLTERRVHRPPGYDGGEEGACGLNILVRADGRRINLGPKAAIPVLAGVSNFTSFVIIMDVEKNDLILEIIT